MIIKKLGKVWEIRKGRGNMEGRINMEGMERVKGLIFKV
jgi:hypothetical protein